MYEINYNFKKLKKPNHIKSNSEAYRLQSWHQQRPTKGCLSCPNIDLSLWMFTTNNVGTKEIFIETDLTRFSVININVNTNSIKPVVG